MVILRLITTPKTEEARRFCFRADVPVVEQIDSQLLWLALRAIATLHGDRGILAVTTDWKISVTIDDVQNDGLTAKAVALLARLQDEEVRLLTKLGLPLTTGPIGVVRENGQVTMENGRAVMQRIDVRNFASV